MALNFIVDGSDRVSLGTGPNMNLANWTYIFVVRFNVAGGWLQWSRNGTSTAGTSIFNGAGLQFGVQSDGGSSWATNTPKGTPRGEHLWVAGTFDETADELKAYFSRLHDPLVLEETATGGTLRGDESGETFYLGNTSILNGAAEAEVSFFGKWDRTFAIAELHEQQENLRVSEGCDVFMHLGRYGLHPRDLSGNGNHGTTSGTTFRGHPAPLALGYGRDGPLQHRKLSPVLAPDWRPEVPFIRRGP